ncbi:MAG: hypothetical protein G3M78_11130 [Candidatus Nitrohelix vancouverensis]|uniref:Uncharacterized protein n=1 Tax=Candidatus Nitrohelix vancouverensis TaxID=2705534 RepID=A0A7T0G418_9BACT|nr:MAG: hypothetical protein G3M78_11130 [Candidatus Nitrohelix vancouverensis]
MPCSDTTASMSVTLDYDERLVDYIFAKLSCDKTVGGGGPFKKYCIGQSIEAIGALSLDALFAQFDTEDEEERFLLYLDWEALTACAALYLGDRSPVDNDRYQIASISQDEKGVTILMDVKPLKEMPPPVSCHTEAKKQNDN